MWDYPRPPAVRPCDHRVRVEWAGEVLADSIHALRVLETSHPPTIYIPPADVRLSLLIASDAGPTWCEFKGEARYLDAVVASQPAPAVAWSYAAPTAGYEACATTSRSIPGAWTPRGLMTNACKHSRATSTEDGSPAIWSARSKARLAPATGSDSAHAKLAALDDPISRPAPACPLTTRRCLSSPVSRAPGDGLQNLPVYPCSAPQRAGSSPRRDGTRI